MSGQSVKSIGETDAVYAKAARAELDKAFDLAFSHYISAAESYLHHARTHPSGRYQERCRNDAKKCLERAQRIKDAKKGELRPLVKDPFSAEQQAYVLERSARVHNIHLRTWEDESDYGSAERGDAESQPSLGSIISGTLPIWHRPHEVYTESDITMASPTLQPYQILQNVVTDCSVCSSIAICLHHRINFGSKIGFSCVYPRDSEKLPRNSLDGKYALRLFINGTFRKVSVDDSLPFYPDGTPISVSTTPSFDLWPSLVEKAYMKVMGGYDFPGSNSSIDVHTLTGWIPEHIEIRSPSFESEKTWMRILKNFQQGLCILTVGTGQRDEVQLSIGETKLLPTHSYAVLDVREESEERWFTILNPWDGALPTSEEAQSMHFDGEIGLRQSMQALHLHEKSSVISVSWNDVCVIFDGIYLNWDPALFGHRIDFHGVWRPKSEKEGPQCIHHHLSFNVHAAKPSDEIWVLLTRHFVDKYRRNEFISVHAQQEEVSGDRSPAGSRHTSLKGTFTSSTHALARLRLDDPIGRVALVTSYDGEYEDVCFTVQVYSPSEIMWDTEPRRPIYMQTIEGTLSTKNAGGNITYPTFMNNPQYCLRLDPEQHKVVGRTSASTRSSVRLIVEGPRNMPLNVMLVWYNGERILQLSQGDTLATSGTYSYGIAQAVASVIPGEYCIVVSAFEPRHRGSFTLRVESSMKFNVEAIPNEGAGMFCKPMKGAWKPGSDGGGPSFGKYTVNPTYEIDSRSATTLKIRLRLTKPSPAIALNVTLFNTSIRGSTLGHQVSTSGPYSDSVSGVVTPQVTIAAGKYRLVVSTYDPGIHAEFQLLVYSKAADVKISEIH